MVGVEVRVGLGLGFVFGNGFGLPAHTTLHALLAHSALHAQNILHKPRAHKIASTAGT